MDYYGTGHPHAQLVEELTLKCKNDIYPQDNHGIVSTCEEKVVHLQRHYVKVYVLSDLK